MLDGVGNYQEFEIFILVIDSQVIHLAFSLISFATISYLLHVLVWYSLDCSRVQWFGTSVEQTSDSLQRPIINTCTIVKPIGLLYQAYNTSYPK